MNDTRFGLILLENPFIRPEDVERCIQIQSLGGQRKPIGQILLEEGVISESTLELVLSIQENRRAARRTRKIDPTRDETMPELAELLARARDRGATDLLLALARRPRARVAGRIEPLSALQIERCWMKGFLRAVLDPTERERLTAERHVVARLRAADGAGCRVTIFHDSYGPAASIRLVPARVPSLAALGHSESVPSLLDNRRGLILVAGGPRSGKSTTIAAMVEHLIQHDAGHVVVLDEYHEFSFTKCDGLVTRKQVAHDERALASALRSSFREDPNVIVVGDLVGVEAVELCMQLASTGHLVIAGVQSSGTVAAVRGLEEGVPEQALPHFRGNLASELRGVVYQDLIPSSKGRQLVLAEEVVVATKIFRRALVEGRLDRIPILLSFEGEQGCVSMDDRLMDLVESEHISMAEAFSRARDRHRFLMTAG